MATNDSYPLLEKTYELLGERKLSLKELAEDAELDESWLAKFHRRAIPNPGVNLVQKLHDYLIRSQQSA